MKSTKKTSIVSWIIYILLYIPLFFSLFYGYVIYAKDTSGNNVHTVHIVFSHHLDVGLDLPFKITGNCVGFATKIVQRYFDEYIPRAISLAEKIRNNNNTQILGCCISFNFYVSLIVFLSYSTMQNLPLLSSLPS